MSDSERIEVSRCPTCAEDAASDAFLAMIISAPASPTTSRSGRDGNDSPETTDFDDESAHAPRRDGRGSPLSSLARTTMICPRVNKRLKAVCSEGGGLVSSSRLAILPLMPFATGATRDEFRKEVDDWRLAQSKRVRTTTSDQLTWSHNNINEPNKFKFTRQRRRQ